MATPRHVQFDRAGRCQSNCAKHDVLDVQRASRFRNQRQPEACPDQREDRVDLAKMLDVTRQNSRFRKLAHEKIIEISSLERRVHDERLAIQILDQYFPPPTQPVPFRHSDQ